MKPLTHKMPVTVRYRSEQRSDFPQQVRRRVAAYFSENKLSRYATPAVIGKNVAWVAVFLLSYVLMLTNRFGGWATLLLGVICGLCTVLLVFNVAHDAAHHALSPQRWVNQWLSYTFNLVGGNGYMWDITHNKIHHAYPNVADLDTDIHQQAPLIRVSPSVPLRPFHRYQHLYAPLLYASYSLFLAFLKDYQDFGLLPKRDSQLLPRRHPWREYLVLFGSKAFYLGYSLLLPLIILEFSWVQILGGFFLVHALMSLSLAVVLIPVHMVDEAPFAEVAPDGTLSHDWTLHVFANTTDYARNSRWANLFFGGLNTHLVHHLFPGVCHAHYIPLSEIIKQTAAECGLTYREVSMGQAIASHFRLLKRMGRPEQT